jgi:hypothetical protein
VGLGGRLILTTGGDDTATLCSRRRVARIGERTGEREKKSSARGLRDPNLFEVVRSMPCSGALRVSTDSDTR